MGVDRRLLDRDRLFAGRSAANTVSPDSKWLIHAGSARVGGDAQPAAKMWVAPDSSCRLSKR